MAGHTKQRYINYTSDLGGPLRKLTGPGARRTSCPVWAVDFPLSPAIVNAKKETRRKRRYRETKKNNVMDPAQVPIVGQDYAQLRQHLIGTCTGILSVRSKAPATRRLMTACVLHDLAESGKCVLSVSVVQTGGKSTNLRRGRRSGLSEACMGDWLLLSQCIIKELFWSSVQNTKREIQDEIKCLNGLFQHWGEVILTLANELECFLMCLDWPYWLCQSVCSTFGNRVYPCYRCFFGLSSLRISFDLEYSFADSDLLIDITYKQRHMIISRTYNCRCTTVTSDPAENLNWSKKKCSPLF